MYHFFGWSNQLYYTGDLDKTDYMNDNLDYLDYWKSDIPKKSRDFEGILEPSK